MKKQFSLLIVLGLMLTLVLGVTQAQSTDDLSTLADYFPEDTPIYFSIRTDEGYITALEDLLAQVKENTGGLLIPDDVTVEALLDQFAMQLTGQPYQVSIGDWLGDSLAVGFTSAEFLAGDMEDPNEIPLLLAFENTNSEVAAFFAAGATELEAPTSEEDGYTLYEGETLTAVLSDDVLLIGTAAVDVEAALEEANPLSSNERFSNTLDALPNDTYNIISYSDALQLNQANVGNFEMLSEELGIDLSMFTEMLLQNSDVTTALGLTIIDGRSLTIDAVNMLSEEMAATTMAAPGSLEQNPVSLEFAEFVPGYAQLVIHDNALGPDALAIFDALNGAGPALQSVIDSVIEDEDLLLQLSDFLRFQLRDQVPFQMRGQLDEMLKPENIAETAGMLDLSVINLGGIIQNQVDSLYAGFTGLNLSADVLSWMTGDYATYFAVIPVESDLDFTFDFGFVTETTDAEAAANIVERLSEVAGLYEIAAEVEEIGGGEAVNFPSLLRAPLSLAFPAEVLADTPELDLMVGYNDDVYAFAARPGVAHALEGGEDSLAAQPAFQYAAENLFLEDTVMVWYVATEPLVSILDVYSDLLPPEDLQQVAFALSQVESMTITASAASDTTTLTRLTLTIPEEVTVELPMGDMGMEEMDDLGDADDVDSMEATEEAEMMDDESEDMGDESEPMDDAGEDDTETEEVPEPAATEES